MLIIYTDFYVKIVSTVIYIKHYIRASSQLKRKLLEIEIIRLYL